jgi:serine/threonine-protein phosphatase 6 regulatory ankyrin repeat subunit B
MILSKGCNVDIQDNNGFTALMWAAKKGHNEICELLINKGCNVDIQNNNGNTALILATEKGHKEICEMIKGMIQTKTNKH